MAQSIRNIISIINTSLAGIFKGSKLYGVAVLVEREGRGKPVVDEQPVGYDDSYAMQMYHRLTGPITITYQPGYGDTTNTVNAFQVSAFVFNNEKITKLKTDEIAMVIQSVLQVLNIDKAVLTASKTNYVRVLPTQIILNSQQIFATEYRGVDYALNEYQSLLQINYTVEISFKGICFDLCPEDFAPCAVTN